MMFHTVGFKLNRGESLQLANAQNNRNWKFASLLVVVGVCTGYVCPAVFAEMQSSKPNAGDVVTNSLGMSLAYVPPGKFSMGSPKDEPGRESQETLHDVELTTGIYMGVHEVTVGQFRQFTREARYKTEAEKDGQGSWGSASTGKFERDAKYNWMSLGFAQTDDHPVVNVSWNDAKAFCQWLSEKENRTYRLPTGAQWEYACRAGTRSAYWFGDDFRDLTTVGNVADASSRQKFSAWSLGINGSDGHAYTAPVGQYKPNRFGLFDMHGTIATARRQVAQNQGIT